jgi:hypothetical protein
LPIFSGIGRVVAALFLLAFAIVPWRSGMTEAARGGPWPRRHL